MLHIAVAAKYELLPYIHKHFTLPALKSLASNSFANLQLNIDGTKFFTWSSLSGFHQVM